MDIRINLENRSPEIADAYSQRNKRSGGLKSSCPPPERRSTISSVMPCIYQNALRLRNLSGGSTTSGSSTNSNQLDNQYFSTDIGNNCNATVQANRSNSSPSSHKKLDRSWSDSDNDRNMLHRSVNSSRYKTELCRPFEESGSCKYGDKCQFAHGYNELRNLARHPKYKTELCRTFHTVGFCPYGPRCHFIHEEETKPEASPKLARSGSVQSSSGSSSPTLSPPSSDDLNVFNYQSDPLSLSSLENHQLSAPLSVNINNCGSYTSNFDQALKQLSLINLNRNNCIDVFSSSNNNIKEPKIIGSEEHDIFSEVTMFRVEDLDNAPKQTSSCAMQSVRLDNFPSVDNFSSVRDASYWNKENLFQIMRPLDPFHHSPTGSDGSSSGSSSDCGGSTESLASTGFTEWRSPVAIGQY